jgi:hypothetical protein
MRKSQKIECFGLPFSSLGPVDFGKPPEPNPARFTWVQFQPEPPQPFPKFCQESVLPVIGRTCSSDFSLGRGGLLQFA